MWYSVSELLQEAEAGLESAQAELAETRQQGDSELTRLGSEWDNTKQSLEDLEVPPSPLRLPLPPVPLKPNRSLDHPSASAVSCVA